MDICSPRAQRDFETGRRVALKHYAGRDWERLQSALNYCQTTLDTTRPSVAGEIAAITELLNQLESA